MRLPRVRFKVLWLMAAVAIIGIVLGTIREVWRLVRHSREYDRKARLAAREERQWRRSLVGYVESEAKARRISADLRVKDPYLAWEWNFEAANRAGTQECAGHRRSSCQTATEVRTGRVAPVGGARPTRRNRASRRSGGVPRCRRSPCRRVSGGTPRAPIKSR